MSDTAMEHNRSPHVAAVILARGGSKGIPSKNLKVIGGHPLIAYAIHACCNTEEITSTWISTDSDAIAEAAEKYGAKVHRRAAYTATDTASSVTGVKEFLEHHPEVDIVVMVQATSPLIIPQYLKEAARKMLDENWDSVFSVTRIHKFTWKDVTGTNESTVPLNFTPSKRPRRQEWSGMMVENGMFYFCKASIAKETFYQDGERVTFIEVPESLSLEVDTHIELHLAEQSLLFLADELGAKGGLRPVVPK
ncbi:unnamed protein product [Notodromas monacha]|uniref:N-acylneuraminate cytidylyltransferase n=1 Tax=Notodromas monacha TaxID=399045 RepID=A0A7R9GFD6_9CRUS|nr:unnamed protein product [Notodromas monacha]CAG0920682.1 unnamed protein product [Notodromas monacha]